MNKIVKINGIEHRIIYSTKSHGETKEDCEGLDLIEDYYLEGDLMLVHNIDKNTYTLLNFINFDNKQDCEEIEIKTISFN